MLHADMAAALADVLIERIAAQIRAELREIALPEPADGLAGELEFAHRHEIEPAKRGMRALRFRIKRADGFERIAEEIEPYGIAKARREEIHQAAAHREFADIANGRGAL